MGLPPVLGRASVKDRMGSPVSVRFISWNCCAVFDDNKLDTLESWIRLENPWIQNDAVDFDVVVVRSRGVPRPFVPVSACLSVPSGGASSTCARRLPLMQFHFQEVGGKTKNLAMLGGVEATLLSCFPDFWNSGMIIETNTKGPRFTALATIAFIRHAVLPRCSIWEWEAPPEECSMTEASSMGGKWIAAKDVARGAPGVPSWVRCVKFPSEVPARKGCQFFKMLIDSTDFLLVNLHNFHDESNLEAYSDSEDGSDYSQKRRATLGILSNWLHLVAHERAFVFGDFNFRLELKYALHWLCTRCIDPELIKTHASADIRVSAFREKDKIKICVTTGADEAPIEMGAIGKKTFGMAIGEQRLTDEVHLHKHGLAAFDHEMLRYNAFAAATPGVGTCLHELPREFPPTYPWCEHSGDYLNTRFPAWCDRVLMTDAARSMVLQTYYTYTSAHRPLVTGDHKPVMLQFGVHPT